MVQPGPDTGREYRSSCSGYNPNDPNLMGFTQNHLSGTGCCDLQDFFLLLNPCGGEYVLGAPQLPKVEIRLANGRIFRVIARGLSRENKYVGSVTLNRRPLKGFLLKHAELVAGGELVFGMTSRRSR